MQRIFSLLSSNRDVNYKVTASYIEIYNEFIRDLLDVNSPYLDLRDDPKLGVVIAGVHWESINDIA